MEGTREKALVGVFVIVAAALLFGITLVKKGGFGASGVRYRAYFKFSGGLEKGAPVRYGGLTIGKITGVHADPANPTRIEIDFAVDPDKIRTDSVAQVSSLTLLSDHYLEISPGTPSAALLKPTSAIPEPEVKSKEAVGFDEIGEAIAALMPSAQAVLKSLNSDLDALHTTIDEATDLLNEKNRANLSSTLANLNGTLEDLRPALNKTLKSVNEILADTQPKLSATLTNVQGATAKIDPLLGDIHKTADTATTTLKHVDDTVAENRENLKASLENMRQVLEKARVLVGQINSTLNQNSDNIDETLDNVRLMTENLRQLTDQLKTSPTSIIRGSGVKDRKPGGAK